jgi:hypothetical protein
VASNLEQATWNERCVLVSSAATCERMQPLRIELQLPLLFSSLPFTRFSAAKYEKLNCNLFRAVRISNVPKLWGEPREGGAVGPLGGGDLFVSPTHLF